MVIFWVHNRIKINKLTNIIFCSTIIKLDMKSVKR